MPLTFLDVWTISFKASSCIGCQVLLLLLNRVSFEHDSTSFSLCLTLTRVPESDYWLYYLLLFYPLFVPFVSTFSRSLRSKEFIRFFRIRSSPSQASDVSRRLELAIPFCLSLLVISCQTVGRRKEAKDKAGNSCLRGIIDIILDCYTTDATSVFHPLDRRTHSLRIMWRNVSRIAISPF